MITKLNICGFKGFKQLEISKISRITLLSGRNNAGKTSILEAIFMFHDRLNPQMVLNQLIRRGMDINLLNHQFVFAPIFYNFNLDEKISITSSINNVDEKMEIKFNPEYLPSVIQIAAGQIGIAQKRDASYALDISYQINKPQQEKQITHLAIGDRELALHIGDAKIKQRHAIFLSARVQTKLSEDAQRFGELDILGRQEEIVKFIQIIEPELKSLSSVALGSNSVIHGDIGLSRKIPVAYMGDGVARLLSIILAIATSKNGLVLIDECENGIHYSSMPKVWEAIAMAAREYNCQVIGTTHSYECLDAARKGIPENFREDFSYIRIDRSKERTRAKCFDYEMLNMAIEANMEVR